MAGMIGKKIGMTSIFNPDGDLIPVTVIKAEPCKVVAIKTEDKDGYRAVQLGYGSKKEKNINKPVLGYYKKKNLSPAEKLKEFTGFDTEEMKVGDEVKVEMFKEGERIKVESRKPRSWVVSADELENKVNHIPGIHPDIVIWQKGDPKFVIDAKFYAKAMNKNKWWSRNEVVGGEKEEREREGRRS